MKQRYLLPFVLGVVAASWSGCGRTAPTEQPAQQSAKPEPVPVHKAPVAGSQLNAAFPESASGLTVTFTQEKEGYAQADLTQSGQKRAQLSISDTNANPSARDKFKTSTRQVAGFPIAAIGNMGTAVLVADRYQVQVRSLSPAFRQADREAWLQKFDFSKLR